MLPRAAEPQISRSSPPPCVDADQGHAGIIRENLNEIGEAAMTARTTIWLCCLFLVSSAAFAQQPSAIQVGVVAAEKKPVSDTNRFVGRIEAIDRVDVRARVTGFLEKVEFKDGDQVKEGAPLYQIEKGPFEATVEQTQAALQKMR